MKRKAGFTLIELLVVIAIIAILAAILFPVFAQAREQARMSTCLSNFKQMGLGVKMYLDDWDETYPMNRIWQNKGGSECNGKGKMITWKHETQPYVKNTGVFKCPSNPRNNLPDETGGDDAFGFTVFPISYAYNGTVLWNSLGANPPVLREAMIPEPSRYIMLIESKSECSDMGIWGFDVNGATSPTFGFFVHSNKRMQALYLDTHARSTKFSQTLGTSQDDQQWSFLDKCLNANCKGIIDTARKNLQNPKVAAVYN